MSPFFSIIVPCYNVQKYVSKCLDSILNQTFTNWECIIGVEQSQDDTVSLIKQKIFGDNRFRLFTNKRSGSCSLTRNIGIDIAQGEYIIFLDGDDWLLNNECLYNIFNVIQQNPNADLYPSIIITSQGAVRDNYIQNDAPKVMTGPEAINYIANRIDRFYCPQLQLTIHKRSFLIQHKLKCIVGLRNQDSQFSPRALYYASKVVPIHIPFYYYNIREGSVQTSVKNRTELNKDWSIIFNSLFKFYGEEIKDKRANIFWVKFQMRLFHFKFFSPYTLQNSSREDRVEHLKFILKGQNLQYYKDIISQGSFKQKVMSYMIRSYLSIPFSRPIIQFAVKKYYITTIKN